MRKLFLYEKVLKILKYIVIYIIQNIYFYNREKKVAIRTILNLCINYFYLIIFHF